MARTRTTGATALRAGWRLVESPRWHAEWPWFSDGTAVEILAVHGARSSEVMIRQESLRVAGACWCADGAQRRCVGVAEDGSPLETIRPERAALAARLPGGTDAP